MTPKRRKRVSGPTGDVQLKVAADCIMTVLGGGATGQTIKELEQIVTSGHHWHCSLGRIPLCTCGYEEAHNFLQLFRGAVHGTALVR